MSHQQPNLSTDATHYDGASSTGHPSSSVNDYNPIATINKEMDSQECRQLLKKVDKMREILRMEKISLPQIVVVGEQSVD